MPTLEQEIKSIERDLNAPCEHMGDLIKHEEARKRLAQMPPRHDFKYFHELVRIEPDLGRLYEISKAYHLVGRRNQFCFHGVWYNLLKPLMCGMVGLGCRNRTLQSQEAYDLAYRTIRDALPDCKCADCQ